MNFTIAQQIKKLSSICVLLLGLHATSQENIKGKVVDASDGQPLVGAQIVLNPSQKGTLTDEFGYFQIDAGSDDNSLIVRYLGYEEQEVSIQHAEKGGELRIPIGESYIQVDGFCKETNTVYEFHGDIFHGNPETEDPDSFCNPYEKT